MAVEDYMLPCLNKKLLGIECFGCGSQRALLMVFKGDFVGAFQLFPAIYPMIFLFILIEYSIFNPQKKLGNWILWVGIITATTMTTSYYIKYPLFDLITH